MTESIHSKLARLKILDMDTYSKLELFNEQGENIFSNEKIFDENGNVNLEIMQSLIDEHREQLEKFLDDCNKKVEEDVINLLEKYHFQIISNKEKYLFMYNTPLESYTGSLSKDLSMFMFKKILNHEGKFNLYMIDDVYPNGQKCYRHANNLEELEELIIDIVSDLNDVSSLLKKPI